MVDDIGTKVVANFDPCLEASAIQLLTKSLLSHITTHTVRNEGLFSSQLLSRGEHADSEIREIVGRRDHVGTEAQLSCLHVVLH